MSEKERGQKRKRLIVPMVAIMMCAVAIVGVGYSLDPTVENNGNEVGLDQPVMVNLYTKNDNGKYEPVAERVFNALDDAGLTVVTKFVVEPGEESGSDVATTYFTIGKESEGNDGSQWTAITEKTDNGAGNTSEGITYDVEGDNVYLVLNEKDVYVGVKASESGKVGVEVTISDGSGEGIATEGGILEYKIQYKDGTEWKDTENGTIQIDVVGGELTGVEVRMVLKINGEKISDYDEKDDRREQFKWTGEGEPELGVNLGGSIDVKFEAMMDGSDAGAGDGS